MYMNTDSGIARILDPYAECTVGPNCTHFFLLNCRRLMLHVIMFVVFYSYVHSRHTQHNHPKLCYQRFRIVLRFLEFYHAEVLDFVTKLMTARPTSNQII